MGLKIQFNLRFMLFAVVPYFVVLGLVPSIVEGMIEDDAILKGSPPLEDIGWKRYLAGVALIGYALSMCYWMTLIMACVYIGPLRRWVTNEPDPDASESES